MCFLKVGSNSNKRLGAMNKLTNVVHSGWMIKSPPEQKLQSPLKIFRAKWKQRFFVLHKPSGSLPDQYELSYFTSEQCSKKKGTIDLEQCEQIIESMDSEQYPYLLAIKTVCRGKVRTYYLATNSEEDMGTWVQCLCRVCSLKQEDSHAPDNRHSLHGTSTSAVSAGTTTTTAAAAAANSSVRSASSVSPSVSSPPVQTPASASSPRPSNNVASSTSSTNSHPSTSPQSYVFLNECTTGKRSGGGGGSGDRYARTDSVDSVPEYQAPPPPPAKRGPQLATIDNDSPRGSLRDSVFDVYHQPPHPPAAEAKEASDRAKTTEEEEELELDGSEVSLEDDDAFYKAPPGNGLPVKAKRGGSESSDVDLNVAVPLPKPRRSLPSACSSLRSERPSSIASSGRPATDAYDVPPPRLLSASSQEGAGGGGGGVVSGGVVGSPPTPPLRPPKPHGLMAVQSPYQNLPTAGGGAGGGGGKGYDSGGLSAVPAAPPPHKQCPSVLGYDVPRSSPFVTPPRDPGVLEVVAPPPAPRSCCGGPAGGHAYLNTGPGLRNAPSVPPQPDASLPARSQDRPQLEDLVYADMDSLTLTTTTTTAPPPPPPAKPPPPTADQVYADVGVGGDRGQEVAQAPPLAPRPPARLAGTLPKGGGGGDSDGPAVWGNVRTKTFIRNSQSAASPSLPARVPPPLERRLPLPARMEFASSSEDDDDLSVDGNNTHHDLSMVRMSTVPAAPDIDTEPELKYLDLALDPDPSRPQATASHGTPTEYREIDFVKTQALQDTKKARDMEK